MTRIPSPSPARAAIQTLGCRLNQTESALMAENLLLNGFQLVSWGEPAEVRIVNSCAVTLAAAQKTRQVVRSARRRFPGALVVVVGCGVAADHEGWLRPGLADLVVANAEKTRIGERCRLALEQGPGSSNPDPGSAAPAEAGSLFTEPAVGHFSGRTRASLKIQEGCNFRCSYCIVPDLRGPPRSRDWEDAVRGFAALLEQGQREIVLTGVNVATYDDHGRTLADLVARFLEFPGDYRLRLSSTEPGPVAEQLAALMRQDRRLCRFLHLSAQYLEDGVLARMKRRYRVEEYAERVRRLAAAVPGICLGTDLIVGFPGETEAEFSACLEMLRTLPLAYVHGFTFSPRPGTEAATLPSRVPERIAGERFDRLAAVAQERAEAFARSQIGQSLQVLVEECGEEEEPRGWSDNYLDIAIRRPPPDLRSNQFVTVRLLGVDAGGRQGWGEIDK